MPIGRVSAIVRKSMSVTRCAVGYVDAEVGPWSLLSFHVYAVVELLSRRIEKKTLCHYLRIICSIVGGVFPWNWFYNFHEFRIFLPLASEWYGLALSNHEAYCNTTRNRRTTSSIDDDYLCGRSYYNVGSHNFLNREMRGLKCRRRMRSQAMILGAFGDWALWHSLAEEYTLQKGIIFIVKIDEYLIKRSKLKIIHKRI